MEHKNKRLSKSHGGTALAKITRPILSGVYERPRLYRLLDRARTRPVVWLHAPAGSGKTTLVTSYLRARGLADLWYQVDAGDNDVASFFYHLGLAANALCPQSDRSPQLLTSEYREGLSVFTVNFFRDLFSRLKRKDVVVLDNYQEVDASGQIQEIIRLALEQIPREINVVIISRELPPAALVRSHVSNHIALLGWDALKLTERESAGIVKLRQKRSVFTSTVMSHLYHDTQGWVAGLVLLAESAERGLDAAVHPQDLSRQSIFDYFASEIFRHGDLRTQTFLLKTAFLPKIVVSIAQELTKESNAQSILEYLTKRNLFTVKHSECVYEYHPLFRAFLVGQVDASYTDAQVRSLKQQSAELLADNGDIVAAVTLLQQAQDWGGALALIRAHAKSLAAQGRTETIETWLNAFPISFRTENPWVLYWLGVCRFDLSPTEAREYFEQAFHLFEKQTDASPLYLSWSGVIDSFTLECDDLCPMTKWLDLYGTLSVNRTPPSADIERDSIVSYVNGLISTRFDHPDLAEYAARVERMLGDESDDDRRLTQIISLIPYYLWSGTPAQLRVLLERLFPLAQAVTAKPRARLYLYVLQAVGINLTGSAEGSLRAITDGLALAETSGVHAFDSQILGFGIWCQLSIGNVGPVRALLYQMARLPRSGRGREVFYRQASSLVLFHEGDTAGAIEEASRTLQLAKVSGMSSITVVSCLINLAYMYSRQGNLDAARLAVVEAKSKALRMGCKAFIFYCELCEANIYRLSGDREQSLCALRYALAGGQEAGVLTPASCDHATAATLYAMALEADIYPEYVRAIITKTRLSPPSDFQSDRWPWPVRIYAFGRFAVVKEGESIAVDGKARKKPLELLRAIVAFGGRDVCIAKLVRTLWPDSDGDTARNTFRATLLRLRRLIGEESISLQESLLTINPGRCWVDVWDFEQLLKDTHKVSSIDTRVEQLLRLYQGAFLLDEEAPWVIAPQERFRSQFLRAVVQFGEAMELECKWREAIVLYQRGIEIDPLAEQLYRRLMHCHCRLNWHAEAIALYRRCYATLTSTLNVEPSTATKSLYADILRVAS